MEGRRVYKEMNITYSEFAQALIQLGFQNQSDATYFRFVNSTHNSRVLLKSNPENTTLFKAIISGYSYQFFMQGVIDDFDDLAKLVEKNREALMQAA
jgi:signal recognition particle subunit SEC65